MASLEAASAFGTGAYFLPRQFKSWELWMFWTQWGEGHQGEHVLDRESIDSSMRETGVLRFRGQKRGALLRGSMLWKGSRTVLMTAGSAALLRSEVGSRPSKFLLQATKHLPIRFEAENPSGDPLAVCHSNAADNSTDVGDSRRR